MAKTFAFAAAVVLLFVFAVVLWLGSSPETGTDREADSERMTALQQLAGIIRVYYDAGGSLPVALGALVDGQRLQSEPRDPVTGKPFEYEILEAELYALCATFDDASTDMQKTDFWYHGSGRICYRLSPAFGEF